MVASAGAAPAPAEPSRASAEATTVAAGGADTDGPHGDDEPPVSAQPLRLSDLPDAAAVAAMPPERQWRRVHAAAVARGLDAYIDPATGYQVWTRLYLRNKGPCCGNACRHCPYGHENVPKSTPEAA